MPRTKHIEITKAGNKNYPKIQMKCLFCNCEFSISTFATTDKWCALGDGYFVKIAKCPNCYGEATKAGKIGPQAFNKMLSF